MRKDGQWEICVLQFICYLVASMLFVRMLWCQRDYFGPAKLAWQNQFERPFVSQCLIIFLVALGAAAIFIPEDWVLRSGIFMLICLILIGIIAIVGQMFEALMDLSRDEIMAFVISAALVGIFILFLLMCIGSLYGVMTSPQTLRLFS